MIPLRFYKKLYQLEPGRFYKSQNTTFYLLKPLNENNHSFPYVDYEQKYWITFSGYGAKYPGEHYWEIEPTPEMMEYIEKWMTKNL